MNLLQLIIIFLALAVCGAVAYVAWQLTSEATRHSGDKPAAHRGRNEGDDPPA